MLSVIMYRPGTDHVVSGVGCEVVRLTFNQITEYEANGWFKSVHEFPNVPRETSKESPDEEGPTGIRKAAKEAGIDGWDTKRLKTLEN